MSQLSTSATAKTPEEPSVIYYPSTGRTEPVWISAEAAHDGAGGLKEQFFDVEKLHRSFYIPEREVERLSWNSGVTLLNSNDCGVETATTWSLGIDAADRNLVGLAQGAIAIVRGTIEDIEPGFWLDAPASLLYLNISGVLKQSPGVSNEGSLWVVHPAARFAVGNRSFCRFEPPGTPTPAIGDEALVFVFFDPRDPAGRLVTADYEQIFIGSPSHGLGFASWMSTDDELYGLKSLDELSAKINLILQINESTAEPRR